MVSYEFVFITKDGDKTLLKNTESIIQNAEGKVSQKEDWGAKPFSYRLNGLTTGHYHVWNIDIEKKNIANLKNRLNLEEGVLRYLLLGNG